MSILTSELFITWSDDVRQVRDLYRGRKYRRCAALCGELLKDSPHPLHKIFLLFYQAVCYEMLGQIAHIYSTNKTSLLEQAKDAFIAASEAFSQIEVREPETWSPYCATLDVLAQYRTPGQHTPFHSPLVDAELHEDTKIGQTSTEPDTPDFNLYMPRPSFDSACDTRESDNSASLYTPRTRPREQQLSTHKARLSQSLSSQHVLATECIPSPLYSRRGSSTVSNKNMGTDSSMPKSTLGSADLFSPFPSMLPAVHLSRTVRPLPSTPCTKPLPGLPFNYRPEFELKGKRLCIVPKRRTALSTLISKFDRVGPFNDEATAQHITNLQESTPATERFQRISQAFEQKIAVQETPSKVRGSHNPRMKRDTINRKKEHVFQICEDKTIAAISTSNSWEHIFSQDVNKENAHVPVHSPPKQDLISIRSTRQNEQQTYTTLLTCFGTTIQTHITQTTKNILAVHSSQLAHAEARQSRFTSTEPSISAPNLEHGEATYRGSKILPAKDNKLRSFWSLQAAEAADRAARVSGSSRLENKTYNHGPRHSGHNARGDRSGMQDEEKRKRIARLKADGWRTVRKEAKGWKGTEYYRELRMNVEDELEMG